MTRMCSVAYIKSIKVVTHDGQTVEIDKMLLIWNVFRLSFLYRSDDGDLLIPIVRFDNEFNPLLNDFKEE